MYVCIIIKIFSVFLHSSNADGNCFFSSISILLVCNSSLVDLLRALEMFLHAEFYADQPIYRYCFFFNREIFPSLKNISHFYVLHKSTDSNLTSHLLVRQQAVNICQNNEWSPYLTLLYLTKELRVFILPSGISDYLLYISNVFYQEHSILCQLFFRRMSWRSCYVVFLKIKHLLSLITMYL